MANDEKLSFKGIVKKMQSNGVYTTNLIKIIIAPPSTPIQPKTLFFAQKASCVVRTTSYLNIIFRQNIQGKMIEEHLGDKTLLSLCRRDAQNKSYFHFCENRDENGAEIHQNENNFCSRRRVDTNSAVFYPPGAPLSFPLGYFV